MEVLDYEKLVTEFEQKLVTQLRQFAPDAEYLEMWVPDADPVKSILNMVEAAEAYGQGEIAVRVRGDLLSASQLSDLQAGVARLGKIEMQDLLGHKLIAVTDIGS